MEVVATRSMSVKTTKGEMVNVFPGWRGEVLLADFEGLAMLGRVIDAKDKAAVKAFMLKQENAPKKPESVREAITAVNKLVGDCRVAEKKNELAEKRVAETQDEINNNSQELTSVRVEMQSTTGDALDRLCLRDVSLKASNDQLRIQLVKRQEELVKTEQEGRKAIRVCGVARGEVFRCESERIIQTVVKDLSLAFAAYDQYSKLYYGNSSSFRSFLTSVDTLLEIKTVDQNLAASVEKSLFKG